jgi:hypothetical protein
VKEKFDALGAREELLHRTGLNGQGIAEAALGLLLNGEEIHFPHAIKPKVERYGDYS